MEESVTEPCNTVGSRYEALKARGMSLDMSRGKPGPDQLNLVSPMLNVLTPDDYCSESGVDCRNYGGVNGIPEIRRIFADILDAPVSGVIAAGNSSLNLMFDRISRCFTHGVNGSEPWQNQRGVKFVCPTPGYDRHFLICEYFNIQMVSIEMTETGPDMDAAEALIQSDPLVKGMWCVPVYSNPTGCVYSDETVLRLARLKPKAPDFRLFWDNAYCVHNFNETRPVIPNIIRECAINGAADMPLVFVSFSKVSFPGAAVSAVAASDNNIKNILKEMNPQTIGPDKINQLRHARFFKNADGVYRHMEKLAKLVKPKFDVVLSALEAELSGLAHWSKPNGGYF
ncbi:MAG: aminotransferase class I/II-fold pyridoxal phosphate-dependent enzyme, partial [Clostridiales bacterium]|nr:aminotransferase class I/II-fold pyridoxal phosphate-dependent enzyme [Clostridiales bacterium]